MSKLTPKRLQKIISICLCILLILSLLFVLLSQLAQRLTNPMQAQKVYSVLQYVPLERGVSFSGLGDSYFKQQQFDKAAGAYTKARRYVGKPQLCSIYIKIGDSNFNQGLAQQDVAEKQRLLQAAVDSYTLCLQREPHNQVASDHKSIAEQLLQQLQQTNNDTQKQKTKTQPKPQSEPINNSADDSTQNTSNW